jgi:hypothetical protein
LQHYSITQLDEKQQLENIGRVCFQTVREDEHMPSHCSRQSMAEVAWHASVQKSIMFTFNFQAAGMNTRI